VRQAPKGVSRQSDVNAFVPDTISIHAGGTVRFVFAGFHDVTFGRGAAPPLAAPTGRTEPVVADAAGRPFWWAGRAPVVGVNRRVLIGRGDGTVRPGSTAGSGLLRVLTAGSGGPAPFDVRFPFAGDYVFRCSVHPGMRGVVHVLPGRAAVSTPADVVAIGGAQLRGAIASLRALPRGRPARGTVDVGTAIRGAELKSMVPRRIVVRVGQTVTFRMPAQHDVHTVTFGPKTVLQGISADFIAPSGSGGAPVFDPRGVYPSEPPGTRQPIAYDGRNHGDGYLNSGLLYPQGTPARVGPTTFRVRFTKAGTYAYRCVIHPGMGGVVVVR
jgi:plastocyanin